MTDRTMGSSVRRWTGVGTQIPDCHGEHALNRLFVPGLRCSLELWPFMKELDSGYEWPELTRARVGL